MLPARRGGHVLPGGSGEATMACTYSESLRAVGSESSCSAKRSPSPWGRGAAAGGGCGHLHQGTPLGGRPRPQGQGAASGDDTAGQDQATPGGQRSAMDNAVMVGQSVIPLTVSPSVPRPGPQGRGLKLTNLSLVESPHPVPG